MLRTLIAAAVLVIALGPAPSAPPAASAATGGDSQANAELLELFHRAGESEHEGHYQESLKLLNQVLAAARSLGNKAAEEVALHGIGQVYASTGRPQSALDYYSQALSLARLLQDKGQEARTLNSMGLIYDNIGQPEKALALYQQAQPLQRAIHDRSSEAATLNNLGKVDTDLRRPEEALQFFSQALSLEREVQDKAAEAVTLNNIAALYDALGQPRKALQYLEQALPVQKAIQDRRGEAVTLTNTGRLYDGIGEPRRALHLYAQALPLARAMMDKATEARTLNNMGEVYLNLGQSQQALKYLSQALAVERAIEDRRGEAMTLADMARVQQRAGLVQTALKYDEQALSLRRELKDQAGEALTLMNIGSVYHHQGAEGKALQCYSNALRLAEAVQDKRVEAATLSNIAEVCDSVGQQRKALEYLSEALPLQRATRDERSQAATLNGLGALDAALGQPQQALEFYERALALDRAAEDKDSQAAVLSNMGLAYQRLGQPQQALDSYGRALSLRRSVGDKAGEATALNNIGGVYSDLGQPQRALDYYRQAWSLHQAVQDRAGQADALANAAGAEERLGRLASAVNHLHQALDLVEATRQELGGLSDAKIGLLASNVSRYDAYIHLLLHQKQAIAAFGWSERCKARALLDLLTAGKAPPARGATPQEQQQVQQLRQQDEQLNQQLVAEAVKATPDQARLTTLKQQLAQADRNLQSYIDLLDVRHPDLARDRLAKTVSLAGVAHFLPADTALLDYVVLNTGFGNKPVDDTVLFCVTLQNGKPVLKVYSVHQPRAALAEQVDDFRQACADPAREYQFKAQELYRSLIAPAAQQLAGKKRLLICPDGPLWGLPFQALVPTDSAAGTPAFLVQRFEIDYAYSATAAQAALQATKDPHRPKPTGTLLAFANPDFGPPPAPDPAVPGGQVLASARPIIADARPIIADARGLFVRGDGSIRPLPGTQKEAEALQQDFPDATILTRKLAQKATALKEAGKYRYLHFATHGLFNDAAPLMSAVVLAQPPGSEEDQFLTARDFCDLHLSADLVVLSACDTARGEKEAGEGVVGLTWALFVAGAPSQVVSQWAVSDESTAALMAKFYAGLKAGKAKGAALRAAERTLLQDGQHAHPYYWAPFILLGDWR